MDSTEDVKPTMEQLQQQIRQLQQMQVAQATQAGQPITSAPSTAPLPPVPTPPTRNPIDEHIDDFAKQMLQYAEKSHEADSTADGLYVAVIRQIANFKRMLEEMKKSGLTKRGDLQRLFEKFADGIEDAKHLLSSFDAKQKAKDMQSIKSAIGCMDALKATLNDIAIMPMYLRLKSMEAEMKNAQDKVRITETKHALLQKDFESEKRACVALDDHIGTMKRDRAVMEDMHNGLKDMQQQQLMLLTNGSAGAAEKPEQPVSKRTRVNARAC